MVGIRTTVDPLVAVRGLAEASANRRGATLSGRGLRLFEGHNGPLETVGEFDPSPFALGRAYELLLAPDTRRRAGAHLTPEAVARRLLDLAPVPQPGDTVLDPSAGGAAFLLAAADQLREVGTDANAILDQLHGLDIDPGAIAVAEAALALWAIDNDVVPRPLENLQVADGLLAALPTVDRIVGNPPFLTQLRSSSSNSAPRRALLKERWGDLVGTYTDDAWLFLAAGVEALAPNGALAMVQPVSVLAARHAASVRHHICHRAGLCALWVARDRVFDASVQVCGIVVSRAEATGPVRRFVGAAFEPCVSLPDQPAPDEWGVAASATFAVPQVHLRHDRSTVRDLASSTAGFRDQFYGLVPYVAESEEQELPRGQSRLVTVGMIDVLDLGWGRHDITFAKQRYRRPIVDVDALLRDDTSLGPWVTARLRPKLVMATQTRVVEVWVDADGVAVPATPVVSIEPHDRFGTADLWLLAAALSSPAVTAHFVAAKFGTALSLNAMKLAARDVLDTPLPTDRVAWQRAADVIRAQTETADRDLRDYATLMSAAYGLDDPDVTTWWLNRVPNRSVGPSTHL